MARYCLAKIGVINTETGEGITRGKAAAWREYQAWLAEGNVPDPAIAVGPVELSAEELAARAAVAARAAEREELAADPAIVALRARTPAQIDAWVAQVSTLAEAKAVLRVLARVVGHVARERLA